MAYQPVPPFLLNATIKHHIEEYEDSHPEVVRALAQSIYVVCGADREHEAHMLYARSKEILSHGSFNLRKFTTNATALQTLVDVQEATRKQANPCDVAQADESYVEATLPTGPTKHPEEQKVLGWNVSLDQLLDQLLFRFDAVTDSGIPVRPTKRMVISLIGRIYDPLGFLAPVTIRFKVLMQELCKNKLGWDQPLDGDLLSKWTKLVEQLRGAPTITLPRCCLQGPRSESKLYRLFGFCDASITAYAAVVYLVEEDEGLAYPSFVVSKTRVSPLKLVQGWNCCQLYAWLD